MRRAQRQRQTNVACAGALPRAIMTAYAQVKPLAQKQKRDRERQVGERKNNKTIAVVRSVERELKRNAGKKTRQRRNGVDFVCSRLNESHLLVYIYSPFSLALSLSLSPSHGLNKFRNNAISPFLAFSGN